MAQPWNEVQASPEYQALSPEDKSALKQRYWDNVISVDPSTQALSDDEKASLQGRFIGAQPENVSEKPVIGNAGDLAFDVGVTTPAHFVNQALMNYPRSLAKKALENPEANKSKTEELMQDYGIQIRPDANNPIIRKVNEFISSPESKTKLGGAIARTAGVAGALASPGNKIALGKIAAGKLAQSAGTGAIQGALYAPENIDDIGARGIQAVGGAIGAPVAGAIGKFLSTTPEMLKGMSRKIMSEYLKPKDKWLLYGKQPERSVVDEKISAYNAEDLLNKLINAKNAVGRSIGESMKAMTGQHDYSNSIKIIDDQINKLMVLSPRERAGTIKRLENIKKDILDTKEATLKDGSVVVVSQKDVTKLTPQEAFDLKNRATSTTNNNPFSQDAASDKIINETMRNVYRSISSKLQKMNPELKNLDRRYSNLKSAIPSLENRIKVGAKNSGIMGDVLSGGAGAGIGALLSSVGMAPGAAAGYLAHKIGQTALARTNLSRGLAAASEEASKLGKVIKDNPLAQAASKYINSPTNLRLRGLNTEAIGREKAVAESVKNVYNFVDKSGTNRIGEIIKSDKNGNYWIKEGGGKVFKITKARLGEKFALAAGATALGASQANASQPSDKDAIKAIIGEVGPYGSEGMQWVAATIKNRNKGVKGVYGGNNPNVINKKYTAKQYEDAKRAWEIAKKQDVTGGATNWFSDADLKQNNVKNIIKKDKLVFIKRVGRNNFYKKGGK